MGIRCGTGRLKWMWISICTEARGVLCEWSLIGRSRGQNVNFIAALEAPRHPELNTAQNQILRSKARWLRRRVLKPNRW